MNSTVELVDKIDNVPLQQEPELKDQQIFLTIINFLDYF